ncbi:hypothetical protein [Streptomyces sp. NPDC060198]|uniref:hypothetical protein n=1 Tax=Streptomyces sp. NPDC060198 TaxID=3347070 RepID=UPI00365C4B30
MKNEIEEAICWSGPAALSIFVLDPNENPVPESAFEFDGHMPSSVGTFRLKIDPQDKRFPEVWECDLTFESLPEDLAEFGEKCLRRATQQDSAVAWLAFEGIFNFDRIFSDTLFAQIYGYYVRVVPQFVVDQCAASDAVHRKAEERPHTGCMRDVPTTRRGAVAVVAHPLGIAGQPLAGQKPVVVDDDATILSSEWRDRIRSVHDFLEERFPAQQQDSEEGKF